MIHEEYCRRVKILNKIRKNQEVVTNKKKALPKQGVEGEKTSKKIDINNEILVNASLSSSVTKIGILRSFRIRQDYFQCSILIINSYRHHGESIELLVKQDENLVLWVGGVYEIEQVQKIELGNGIAFDFARLLPVQNQ